jgi:hypothetical protein
MWALQIENIMVYKTLLKLSLTLLFQGGLLLLKQMIAPKLLLIMIPCFHEMYCFKIREA